jgi:hypothetical protein
MNGTRVKALVEALVFVMMACLLVYCQVRGIVIQDPVMWIIASVVLGSFGFSAVEHWRRQE